MSTSLSVNCPTCLKQVPWTADNAHRPFCSERCKLLDLGDWAAERFAIPGEPVSPHDEQGEVSGQEHYLD